MQRIGLPSPVSPALSAPLPLLASPSSRPPLSLPRPPSGPCSYVLCSATCWTCPLGEPTHSPRATSKTKLICRTPVAHCPLLPAQSPQGHPLQFCVLHFLPPWAAVIQCERPHCLSQPAGLPSLRPLTAQLPGPHPKSMLVWDGLCHPETGRVL